MSKYENFDKVLVTAIELGSNTMMSLASLTTVKKLAKPFAIETNNPTFRIIDRRLQALRKAGKISYSNKAWVVVK